MHKYTAQGHSSAVEWSWDSVLGCPGSPASRCAQTDVVLPISVLNVAFRLPLTQPMGKKNQQQPTTQLCGDDGETDMRPCPMGEM